MMSVDVYLVDKIQHFNLPIKYLALQNLSDIKTKITNNTYYA